MLVLFLAPLLIIALTYKSSRHVSTPPSFLLGERLASVPLTEPYVQYYRIRLFI